MPKQSPFENGFHGGTNNQDMCRNNPLSRMVSTTLAQAIGPCQLGAETIPFREWFPLQNISQLRRPCRNNPLSRMVSTSLNLIASVCAETIPFREWFPLSGGDTQSVNRKVPKQSPFENGFHNIFLLLLKSLCSAETIPFREWFPQLCSKTYRSFWRCRNNPLSRMVSTPISVK